MKLQHNAFYEPDAADATAASHASSLAEEIHAQTRAWLPRLHVKLHGKLHRQAGQASKQPIAIASTSREKLSMRETERKRL